MGLGQTARSSRNSIGWSSRLVGFLVAGEVVLSLVLGAYRLGRKSLWFDEGFTAMATTHGLTGVFRSARHFDSNMFGYNVALSAWRAAFGSSEAALRSLSLVAVASTVVAVFLVASRLYGSATGVYAGFLLAIAPFAVRYAQEARSYALLVLLVTLASYFFVVGIERRDSRWLALYAITAAASCYAHFFGGLVIVAHAASVFFLRRRDVPARQLAITAGAIVGLLLPLGYFVLSAEQGAGSGSKPTVASAASVFSNVAGGKLLVAVMAGLCLIPGAMAWHSWRGRGRSFETWRLAFVFTWLVIPYVTALVAALIIQPNWQDRYMIVILPALAMAAALGISRIGDRRLVAALLVVISVFAGLKVRNWYQAPAHEDWRNAVKYVTSAASPGDGIVFCIPSVRAPFEYYALQYPAGRRPQPLSPPAPWSNDLHLTSATADTVSAWRSAPERIWVVSRYASPNAGGACDLSTSTGGRKLAASNDIGGVLVERYDLG